MSEEAKNEPAGEETATEQEMAELYEQFMARGGICKLHDIVFMAVMLIILAVVWVYVYKQPIPAAVLGILGMDDTIYPEMVQNDL